MTQDGEWDEFEDEEIALKGIKKTILKGVQATKNIVKVLETVSDVKKSEHVEKEK